MDEQLYRQLKRVAGPRGMSRFIAEAVREKLGSKGDQLYEEYLAAQDEPERQEILEDWDAIETEGRH